VPGFFVIETALPWAVCLAQLVFACALALHGGNMPAYLVYKVQLPVLAPSPLPDIFV
jgi:hypothetical protein